MYQGSDLNVDTIVYNLAELRSSVALVVAIECVSFQETLVYTPHFEEGSLELKSRFQVSSI